MACAFALPFASASFAEDPAVLHIRKEYQSIQSALPRLKAEPLELSGYSTEGGEAKAFRDNMGNIPLIAVQLYGESGKVFEEFYYENGALIFAFYKQYHYNVPSYISQELAKEMGGEAFDPQKSTITEDRYYFNNGKMIKWLDEQEIPVQAESTEFKDTEKDVLEAANEMLSKFKEKPNE